MDKVVASAADAVADVADGATLLLGGFGVIQGWAASCILALAARGPRGLTIVANTPGVGPLSPQVLAERGGGGRRELRGIRRSRADGRRHQGRADR
jgi:3-oxoacid CoA-transferase subunit A